MESADFSNLRLLSILKQERWPFILMCIGVNVWPKYESSLNTPGNSLQTLHLLNI